ncbi:MAG: regulatory iron-sulfur-containing complex subunit RicT [Phycisphaeraceae bacterium]
MPGSIMPLPVMLDEEDQKIYDKLEPPKSMVVRYGYMKLVAELPYDGDAKPGCGSKLVVRTARGIELAEMLTTTCANSGCGKSVSRKEMLEYIDNSGGKNYPFTTQGKILRVATIDDLNEQARIEAGKTDMIRRARTVIRELDLAMKLVDVELLLGGERIIFHYTSEDWIDFRELVRRLAADYQTRIEMHQVNARDEARLVADYEKCGQHCCCKQFLKVLKPVSMRSAKVQKATLDPSKISGRCGRLMCCLRYEDETYEDLRKRLPKRQTRVMTEEGPGTVIDTQILTQLVLVVLDKDPAPQAIALENITVLSREEDAKIRQEQEQQQQQQADARSARPQRPERPRREDRRPDDRGPKPSGQEPPADREGRADSRGDRPRRDEPRRPQPGRPLREEEVESREGGPAEEEVKPNAGGVNDAMQDDGDGADTDDSNTAGAVNAEQGEESSPGGENSNQGGEGGRKRKRRRRRRRRGGPGGGGESGGGNPGTSPGGG